MYFHVFPVKWNWRSVLVLLTHQLWRQARPVYVLYMHPHWDSNTWGTKPGWEVITPQRQGTADGFGGRGRVLKRTVRSSVLPWWEQEQLSQRGRERRTYDWRLAVGEGLVYLFWQNLKISLKWSWNHRVVFHPFLLWSHAWKRQYKRRLARVRRTWMEDNKFFLRSHPTTIK